MNKNSGIGILLLCFSFSAVNLARATEALQVSPIIVQPYEIQELNQQMLNRDRQNRDREIAIQGLIEENNKLTQESLSRQEDEGLKKINQIMLSYRDALYSRDQERIMANSERRYSRYGDLVALTQEVDAARGIRGDLETKSGLLAEKFQMLTELRDEMTALNERLRGERVDALNQKDKIIEGYKDIAQKQQDKIQMLIGKLDEMDQKISRFDEIIAQKDLQIAHLKDSLVTAQRESFFKDNTIKQQGLDLKAKDGSIRWLNQVLAATKNKAEYYRLISQLDQITLQQVLSRKQTQVDLLKSELENKINALHQKEQQVGLLNIELKNKTAQEKNQSVLEYQIQDLKAQSDQMTLLISDYQKKLESKNNAYNQQLQQVRSFKNDQARMEGQIVDLTARLQEKEAQIVKIKKDMYDLQESVSAKDRENQAKDLSLFMVQRRSMPGRDEIDFLRTGLKAATLQLKQKDEMLSQIKANADEYAKEFKEQSKEFQSLKVQLKNAQSTIPENDNALLKGDRLREKLKQALDEIDEQGRAVNALVQKLQDAGQSVNLTQYFSKKVSQP